MKGIYEMVRPALAVVFLMTVANGLSAPLHAQTTQQRQWCDEKDGASLAQKVIGCTAIIKSTRDAPGIQASAFNSRGNAYAGVGRYGLAIQDFDQAIKLDPKNADA